MKYLKPNQWKKLIHEIRSEGVSMRHRFTGYLISVVAMVLSLILLLLNVTGVMNPASRQIKNELDTQMLMHAAHLEQDFGKIAAHAVSFADQMEVEIQKYLSPDREQFRIREGNAFGISQFPADKTGFERYCFHFIQNVFNFCFCFLVLQLYILGQNNVQTVRFHF